MRDRVVVPTLAVLFAAEVLCQSPAPKPAFEIADVHASPRADWVQTKRMRSGFFNAGRYEIRRATMLDLITTAYSVDADQVFGGPPWLGYDRFEVIAKAPRTTSAADIRLMLQSLLADRFHLVLHPDSKPIPAWVLSVARGGSKLKHAGDSGSTGCQVLLSTANFSDLSIQCHSVDLNAFLATLRTHAASSFNRLPLVDATGIGGVWDIDVQVSPARISESIGSQLGLTLELKTAPQPVLSVESVTEQPTANPPGVAAALPPLPAPEFEVASIKPCDGKLPASLPLHSPHDLVSYHCESLLLLIKRLWGLAPYQELLGAPKWLTSDDAGSYSIEAKAPPGTLVDRHGTDDPDALNAMMRALLVDRFRMSVHYEDRPTDAWTLVAVKPKLTKADPAARTGCTRQPPPGQGMRGQGMRLVCRNVTMAQFAEQIPAYNTMIFFPVLDSTAIEGGWDFTLDFSIALPRLFLPIAGASPEPGQASDPVMGLSFSNALVKQLGLKLEMKKLPERVLVIDRIERKPTAN